MYRHIIKRLIDFVLSFVGLILLAIPMLIFALIVKLDSPGPVLFWQKRVGIQKKTSMMPKFRTMYTSTPANMPTHLLADPQKWITRSGVWFRRLSIDELPQLFNVLRGDMSLVGPRPPLPSEVAQYEPRVMGKFAVRPGITGLWQISGRSNLSWDETVHLDLSYAQHRSLTLDAWIMLQTIPALLRHEGAY